MFKSAIALAAAAPLMAAPALAGPYVNVETNAGWAGDDYVGATTDIHVGYGGALGEDASWYIQGGPAIVAIDGEENETRYSGKVGIAADLTDRLGVYGELSALTATDSLEMDDLGVGGKLGATFSF